MYVVKDAFQFLGSLPINFIGPEPVFLCFGGENKKGRNIV